MPIVAHSSLPTFSDLRREGHEVLTLSDALSQDIRELHVGLLNMMPDAALQVTERQFVRLVGSANRIVQLYVHPFTVDGLPRSQEAREHVARHYERFETLQEEGLDGLIVSGANVSSPHLQEQPFYAPLAAVMEWATAHVTSVLCSCLATHALLQHFHGIHRRPMQAKRWGVYQHRAVRPEHPLLAGTNTRFDVPHSRWNDVSSAQVEGAGIEVLVESTQGDFHLGVSRDGLRMVYLQGHPEYDTQSLLKEYKREVARYHAGELDVLPPMPAHYFTPEAARIARRHLEDVIAAKQSGRPLPGFPEDALVGLLDNTWADTGAAIFNNWLGLIYRLTSMERGEPFMPGVDPDDPLGLAGP